MSYFWGSLWWESREITCWWTKGGADLLLISNKGSNEHVSSMHKYLPHWRRCSHPRFGSVIRVLIASGHQRWEVKWPNEILWIGIGVVRNTTKADPVKLCMNIVWIVAYGLCKEHLWHFTAYPRLAALSWFDIRIFDLIFNSQETCIGSTKFLQTDLVCKHPLKSIWQWFRHSTCRDLKDSEGKVHGPVGCLKGSAVRHLSLSSWEIEHSLRKWQHFLRDVQGNIEVFASNVFRFRVNLFYIHELSWICTHLFRSPGPQGYNKDREVIPWISSRSHQVINLSPQDNHLREAHRKSFKKKHLLIHPNFTPQFLEYGVVVEGLIEQHISIPV